MSKTHYYHGGIPGLKAGQRVEPPTVTGNRWARSSDTVPGGGRPDRVYVVTDRAEAEVYAAFYPGGGWIYKVVPDPPLTPDPDCLVPGLSWECSGATVRSVIARIEAPR